MNKTYTVTGQIEIDGVTHRAGSTVELSDEQAAQAAGAVEPNGEQAGELIGDAAGAANKTSADAQSKAKAKR